MSLPYLPSPPYRPPPLPPTSRQQGSTPLPTSILSKPWWPFDPASAASPAKQLPLLRAMLQRFIESHETYMNDYRKAHERIHVIYGRMRTLRAQRHLDVPALYERASLRYDAKRNSASRQMGAAREKVRNVRVLIKRVQKTIAEWEKLVAAEKLGILALSSTMVGP